MSAPPDYAEGQLKAQAEQNGWAPGELERAYWTVRDIVHGWRENEDAKALQIVRHLLAMGWAPPGTDRPTAEDGPRNTGTGSAT